MPAQNSGTTAKPKRTYTEPEKMAAMTLAVLTTEQQASNELGIPRQTIGEWLEKFGGVGKVRQELESKELLALEDARRATALEWVRRAKDLSDGELGQTLRAMLQEGAAPAAGAQASAQAGVIVVQYNGEQLTILDPDESGDGTVP